MTAATLELTRVAGKHHWTRLDGWETASRLYDIEALDENEKVKSPDAYQPRRRIDRAITGGLMWRAGDRKQAWGGFLIMLRDLTAEQEDAVVSNSKWWISTTPEVAQRDGFAQFSYNVAYGWVYHVPHDRWVGY